MRKAVLITALALLGCSKAQPDRSPGSVGTMDVAESQENGTAGPDVAPTAVAGVAMTYTYAFRLPAAQIAATQEKHAVQCEALGPTRCRITGMEYHAGRDRSITAQTSFKLAPELARRFGKQGIDAVVAAGGMLEDAKIDSSEEGATIAAAQTADASFAAEQKELATQLARPGLSAAERTQLQARQTSLLDSRRSVSAAQADSALKLASTPMTFGYASGKVDPGLSDGPWLGAVKDGWSNVMSGLPALVTILITLAPWAVVLGLCAWLWRRFARRPRPPTDGA